MSERQRIVDRLRQFSEPMLRRLIENFSKNELGDSADIHGTGEHGVDVVTLIKSDYDPIGKSQVLLFQVKKRDITLPRWRDKLCGQLAEMYFRTIRALNINENSPRRIVLVHGGRMTPEVHTAISDWNKKIPIPIEIVSLEHLASLLDKKGYSARGIRRLSR